MRSRRLSLVRKTWLVAELFLSLPSAAVRAQTSMTAFLPEVNSHFRLSSNVRLVFDAKGYMEDGDLNHAQVGLSLQFNIRPLEKLKRITIFDMDDMKPMPVVFTIGYRYLPSSVQPAIQPLQPIVMFHIPFPGTILLSDRNRGDLDWSIGSFHWTYRNRFTGERRAEFFYQSQYAKWSSTHLFAGCLFPLSKHIQLDTYYEHANNTGPYPNHQVNAAGLIIDLYFPPYSTEQGPSSHKRNLPLSGQALFLHRSFKPRRSARRPGRSVCRAELALASEEMTLGTKSAVKKVSPRQ